MPLPFTGETILNPEGRRCPVLDVSKVDFTNAVTGRKKTETIVRRAKGGEVIETRNTSGKIESTYTTRPGDAIFVDMHNDKDMYCPGDSDAARWKFDDFLGKGYEITAGSLAHGTVKVKSTATAQILPEAVTEDLCIKDAWGAGKHQYLYSGATLKQGDNGKVTGIDKSAFDATWEVLTPRTIRPNSPQRRPKP